MNYEKFKRHICFDFDGVVHAYRKGWQGTHGGGSVYDPPLPGAVKGIAKLLDHGYTVVILTARTKEDIERNVKPWVRRYFKTCADRIEVTNVKPPALMYIDDRGYRFTNWTDVMNLFL